MPYNDNLVIIPTYNECENIKDIILEIFSLEDPFDILIVDDSSPDGTSDIVRKLIGNYHVDARNRLFLEERKGKLGLGTAYIHGFKFALDHGYKYIFEMDADFSHNPVDLIKLCNACKDGNDVVIGSRYVGGVNVVNWPIGRVLLSYFASAYVRFITGMPISDATAGFKCYNRKVLESIDLDKIKFVGYAFQIEMKFSAWKKGFRIKEIPIIFTDRTRGISKMSTGIIKEAVFGVIAMKINSLFKKYQVN